MEIIAEFLGIDTDKGAWEYFCNHWRSWFPAIGSRANFAKHAANLWAIKQQMQKELAIQLGAFSDSLCRYVISNEQISVKYFQVKQAMVIVRPRVRHMMGSMVMY